MSSEREITDDRYSIEARVGSGAMATVYRAYDQRLQRTIALKILHEHLTSDSDLNLRFNQEAKLAGRIDHPNVVRIYDMGINKQNQLFIVSEFVDGQSLTLALRQYMNRANPYLNPVLAALVGHEIARGMNAAHEHLVVHRDLKPDNVLVSNNGDVKLTDFGVARPFDSSMTQAGQFIGSLTYASPEQVSGTKIDTRSDIFSFGVILFELLTGQLPFRSTNPTDLAIKITNAQIPPLNQIRASIPLELDSVVRKCLRADPAERPQNAGQIVHELAQFLARNEVQISSKMIHDGFKNPSLFNSTIRRSPLATSTPDDAQSSASETLQTLEIQTQPLPEVPKEPSPSSILPETAPQQVSPPVPKITPVNQRRRIKSASAPTSGPTQNKTSSFPFLLLVTSISLFAGLIFALKNREALKQFVADSREISGADQNSTPLPEPTLPASGPTQIQPTPNLAETVTPAPTASAETPAPIRTPTARPAPSQTPQKAKTPLPSPKPTRTAIKPKAAPVQPTKSVTKTKPTPVSKNVSAERKTSTLVVKTNPGEIPIFIIYPNAAPDFLGLSFNNKERVFPSVRPGTVIVRAEPGEPNAKFFDAREKRITLTAGQKTEVTLNLLPSVKVTLACAAEVKITKVNGRAAQHRGGDYTFNAPLNETVVIEAVHETRGRSSARLKIQKASQIIECPFDFRRDR